MTTTTTAFDFEVITPEGSAFRGRVTSLRLQGREGSFGILAHHAPLVAALDAGPARVVAEDGKVHVFAFGEGFVEVRKTGVRALVDFSNRKEEIDRARAEEARKRAAERVRSPDPKIDHVRAEAALRRALARLSAADITGA